MSSRISSCGNSGASSVTDGGVKGCPSLQRDYVRSNLRDQSVADAFSGGQLAVDKELWGFCATCPFAATCKGGCSFTAHAIFGRPGNNPYCHYRARALAKQGLRERLVPASAAPGLPFDSGTFDVVVEPLDSPDPSARISLQVFATLT